MLEQRGGWFVTNVKDARWYGNAAFGKTCSFEDPEQPFPQTGVRLYVLEPDQPNCRYHRESAQEDFLVLSGRCRLLVNGEERHNDLLKPSLAATLESFDRRRDPGTLCSAKLCFDLKIDDWERQKQYVKT